MMHDLTPWLAVLVMAGTVLALRYSGFAIMSFVQITPRIELFLEKMSISVLVALVATSVSTGGLRTTAAVGIGIAVMFLSKSPIAAMLAGIAAGAAWNAVFL